MSLLQCTGGAVNAVKGFALAVPKAGSLRPVLVQAPRRCTGGAVRAVQTEPTCTAGCRECISAAACASCLRQLSYRCHIASNSAVRCLSRSSSFVCLLWTLQHPSPAQTHAGTAGHYAKSTHGNTVAQGTTSSELKGQQAVGTSGRAAQPLAMACSAMVTISRRSSQASADQHSRRSEARTACVRTAGTASPLHSTESAG